MSSITLYKYVGPKDILKRVHPEFEGRVVQNSADIIEWLNDTQQHIRNAILTVTFVIDEDGNLRIADRHSEHVMCANGRPVRSAGEMTFERDGKSIEIIEVTNQSTGYCPRAESWTEVKTCLSRIDIEYPSYFTHAFEFRLCKNCNTINLIKEDEFQCAVCSADLEKDWNF